MQPVQLLRLGNFIVQRKAAQRDGRRNFLRKKLLADPFAHLIGGIATSPRGELVIRSARSRHPESVSAKCCCGAS
jgi:hypothetical protein